MLLRGVVFIALVAAIAPAGASAHGGAPIARTETGLVRGFTADHAEKFLGIPYAAAPLGERRWRARRRRRRGTASETRRTTGHAARSRARTASWSSRSTTGSASSASSATRR